MAPEFFLVALRPDALPDRSQQSTGDYRMPMMTRRTLAQSACELVEAREHAPGAVRMTSLYGRLPHRPV